MSTLTRVWDAETIRKIIRNIDKNAGLGLNGASLPIVMNNTKRAIGQYFGKSCKTRKFTFSKYLLEKPDFPELDAYDTIYHEYAHYMTDELNLKDNFEPNLRTPHGPAWRFACSLLETYSRAAVKRTDFQAISEETAKHLFNADYLDKKNIENTFRDFIGNKDHRYIVKKHTKATGTQNGSDCYLCVKCKKKVTVVLPAASSYEPFGGKAPSVTPAPAKPDRTTPVTPNTPPVKTPTSSQYTPPVKTPTYSQYTPHVKTPTYSQYTPPVKTPTSSQYTPPVKTPPSSQYTVPVKAPANSQHTKPVQPTASKPASVITTVLAFILSIICFLFAVAQSFPKGNIPDFLNSFDIGLASLKYALRALLAALIMHLPLIPITYLVMREKRKYISEAAERIQLLAYIIGILLSIVTASIVLFTQSGLSREEIWISILIYASFEIMVLFSQLFVSVS